MDQNSFGILKKNKFKLCLVSPEIQGYDEIESINLKKFLKQKNFGILKEPIEYSILGQGKRLRPLLCMETAKVFNIKDDVSIFCAMAIECIHTYSLIHDDLPAMDDSDTRRGQPACHKAFDEVTAILAGDALQPMAFELLAKSYADIPEVAVDLVRLLAETAGSQQLVGGQMQDLISQ